jgi:hypothetical protein
MGKIPTDDKYPMSISNSVKHQVVPDSTLSWRSAASSSWTMPRGPATGSCWGCRRLSLLRLILFAKLPVYSLINKPWKLHCSIFFSFYAFWIFAQFKKQASIPLYYLLDFTKYFLSVNTNSGTPVMSLTVRFVDYYTSHFSVLNQWEEEKYFILFCYWLKLKGTLPMSL